MIHLKTYQVFESDTYFNSISFDDDELDSIKSYLRDIFYELEDDNFDIEIDGPRFKNLYRLNISIIKIVENEKADTYKLGDISEVIHRVYDYLESVGCEIDEVDSMNTFNVPSKKINVDKDIDKWDLSQELLVTNFYFTKKNKVFNESIKPEYDTDWKRPGNPVREELEVELREILLEVIDLGYRPQLGGFTRGFSVNGPHVWICNHRRLSHDDFWNEITDTVERVKDYLIGKGFKVNQEIINEDTRNEQVFIYFNLTN